MRRASAQGTARPPRRGGADRPRRCSAAVRRGCRGPRSSAPLGRVPVALEVLAPPLNARRSRVSPSDLTTPAELERTPCRTSRRRPCAHHAVRGRGDVSQTRCASSRSPKSPPRPGDGRGGPVPSRPHPAILRARPDGDRSARSSWRRRRRHLPRRARHRGAGAGRRLRGDLRGRPQHPGQQLRCSGGARPKQHRRTSRGSPSGLLGAFALSEPASGSDAFALANAAERKGATLGADRAEVLDHQRRRGGLFIVFANADPAKGYKGITGVRRRTRLPRLRRGQEGGQARDPRVEHHAS